MSKYSNSADKVRFKTVNNLQVGEYIETIFKDSNDHHRMVYRWERVIEPPLLEGNKYTVTTETQTKFYDLNATIRYRAQMKVVTP